LNNRKQVFLPKSEQSSKQETWANKSSASGATVLHFAVTMGAPLLVGELLRNQALDQMQPGQRKAYLTTQRDDSARNVAVRRARGKRDVGPNQLKLPNGAGKPFGTSIYRLTHILCG